MVTYTKADILCLCRRIYKEAGGKERIIERIKNYLNVPVYSKSIHNYYYVHKNVYDYSDLNATLGQAALALSNSGDESITAGQNYIDILIALAGVGFLTDDNYTFCDKAFDGFACSLLVHTWLLLKESQILDKISTKDDRQVIEEWFYLRAQLMWRDRNAPAWSTFRPYDNQEIGIGCCILLSRFLQNKDPALSRNLQDLADSRLIGWKKKNGNLDDTLFYTPIFCLTLYFYAVYRPCPEMLTLENCRQTFEGMLQQQPGNGIFTLYNWTQCTSAPSMMALGSFIFKDSHYKWMACRMLEERLEYRNKRQQYAQRSITPERLNLLLSNPDDAEQREVVEEEVERLGRYDHVWEGMTDNVFHLWYFWDDSLQADPPETGSMVLEKSAGQGRWPYDPAPILYDKVVLRDGWKNDDFFLLLNLWGGQNSPTGKTVSHRYAGANEIISLVCGEQFLVQNINQVTRDGLIHRKDLNAFNIFRNGEWMHGFSPDIVNFNAELRIIESLQWVDCSKSTLYDYFGWTSERTVFLQHGKYAVVFDQARGTSCDTIGVRWHLQGEEIFSDHQTMKMQLLDRGITLQYPHNEDWYTIQKESNTRPIAIYQHHADLDLDFISKGTTFGSVLIFLPKNAKTISIPLDVKCLENSAYPEAMGVKIGSDYVGTRMGQYRNDYDYGPITTDADAFMMKNEGGRIELALFGAKFVRIKDVRSTHIHFLRGSVATQLEQNDSWIYMNFSKPVNDLITLWIEPFVAVDRKNEENSTES